MRNTNTHTTEYSATATRRKLLALVGAGVTVPLAGCGGSDSQESSEPRNQKTEQDNESDDPPGNGTVADDEDMGNDGSGTDNGGCPELPLSYTTVETSGLDPGLQFDVPANTADDVEMPSSLDGYESQLVIRYRPRMESQRSGITFTFTIHNPNTEGFENPREQGVDGIAGNFLLSNVDNDYIETTSEYDRDIYTRIVRDTSEERPNDIVIFPYGDRVIEANGVLFVEGEGTSCSDVAEAAYKRAVSTIRPIESS